MPDTAPAPVSDATLAAAPEFVVDGTWDDKEWRDIAAKPSSARSEAEIYVWAGGPRPHPWGRAAHMTKRQDGTAVVFPSKPAYEAYVAAGHDTEMQGAANAQTALAALNAGLAAHAGNHVVPPSSDPVQADAMLEAASPHGTIAR